MPKTRQSTMKYAKEHTETESSSASIKPKMDKPGDSTELNKPIASPGLETNQPIASPGREPNKSRDSPCPETNNPQNGPDPDPEMKRMPRDSPDPEMPCKVDRENFWKWTSAVTVVVAVVAIGLWYFLGGFQSPVTETIVKVPPQDIFNKSIHGLEDQFLAQDKRFWRTIKASGKRVLKDGESSKYPSVILMVTKPENAQVASCLANRVATEFEAAWSGKTSEPLHLDITKIKEKNSAEQKKHLYEVVDSGFSDNIHKSIVIENLQSLAPEAALLLHGYCDNEDANFKDIMMILTLIVDVKETAGEELDADTSEDFLRGIWEQGLHRDKVGPLLARVANNIVVVKHEDESVMNKFCQFPRP